VVAYSSRAACVRVRRARGPMLASQRFDYAALTISGIELVQKLQKEQFKTGKLDGRSATVPRMTHATARTKRDCAVSRPRAGVSAPA
jgi:hypothetical protein